MGRIAQNPLVASAATPPQYDKANFVVQGGPITAAGPLAAAYCYGPFNCAVWGATNTTLTTTAGTNSATVASATGLVVGMSVVGVNVPPGTTIASIVTTTLTFNFAPGFSAANITGGVDATALFPQTVWSGTVAVERSFDGGLTWLTAGVGGTGLGAIYTGANQASANPLAPSGIYPAVSLVVGEPEQGILYRVNVLVYTSGSIYYRISGTGAAAAAWAFSSAI